MIKIRHCHGNFTFISPYLERCPLYWNRDLVSMSIKIHIYKYMYDFTYVLIFKKQLQNLNILCNSHKHPLYGTAMFFSFSPKFPHFLSLPYSVWPAIIIQYASQCGAQGSLPRGRWNIQPRKFIIAICLVMFQSCNLNHVNLKIWI